LTYLANRAILKSLPVLYHFIVLCPENLGLNFCSRSLCAAGSRAVLARSTGVSPVPSAVDKITTSKGTTPQPKGALPGGTHSTCRAPAVKTSQGLRI
jgi:hypothetical protein